MADLGDYARFDAKSAGEIFARLKESGAIRIHEGIDRDGLSPNELLVAKARRKSGWGRLDHLMRHQMMYVGTNSAAYLELRDKIKATQPSQLGAIVHEMYLSRTKAGLNPRPVLLLSLFEKHGLYKIRVVKDSEWPLHYYRGTKLLFVSNSLSSVWTLDR